MKAWTKRLLLVCAAAASASAAIVSVPGTSDPWLAGMPDGTNASFNDFAPPQSPVPVPGLSLTAGDVLTFTVSGAVSYTPICCTSAPDGDTIFMHGTGAENGIADVTAPLNALMGVFLGSDQPDLSAAPPALDFSGAGALDFLSLAPGLKQVFFIGDGRTSGAAVQQFVIPTGATRLYLGPMDGVEWNNNSGAFRVEVEVGTAGVPEPATFVLLGSALIGLAIVRRRRP